MLHELELRQTFRRKDLSTRQVRQSSFRIKATRSSRTGAPVCEGTSRCLTRTPITRVVVHKKAPYSLQTSCTALKRKALNCVLSGYELSVLSTFYRLRMHAVGSMLV